MRLIHLFSLFFFLVSFNIYAQGDCVDENQIDNDVFCISLWDPVCGCNGITYGNDCEAFYWGGVTSWTNGECSDGGCIDPEQIDPDAICPLIWDPVCGCNNVTYSNDCEAFNFGGVTSWTQGECGQGGGLFCQDLAGLDFGACDMPLGMALINGECVMVSGCGTIASDGVDYAQNFFPSEVHCQAACGDDVTCMDLSNVDFGPCDAIIGIGWYNGECTELSGCSQTDVNGIDFSNYFFEDAEACMSFCSGECINPELIDPLILCADILEPVCGCDSVTYINDCIATYHYGVSSFTEGPCSEPANCYVEEQQNPEYPCTEEFDPVCGCDGEDYSNPCNAYYYGGVQSWTPGPCVNSIDDLDELDIDLYPNPVTDVLTFSNLKGVLNLKVYNATGQLVMAEMIRNESQYVVDVSSWETGVYLIRISDDFGKSKIASILKY